MKFSPNAAAVCLQRWKKRLLIEAAGDRAKIYFNKLKCAEVDTALRVEAFRYEYPTATLCGESVLHARGWITQIPSRLSVAVLSRPSYVSFYGFEIHARPLTWFKKVHPAVTAADNEALYGLRALPPALALADLYADKRAWHPDVDDLDIPEDEFAELLAAARMLEGKLPAAMHLVPARDLWGMRQCLVTSTSAPAISKRRPPSTTQFSCRLAWSAVSPAIRNGIERLLGWGIYEDGGTPRTCVLDRHTVRPKARFDG